jgi:hypothetical protein
MDSRDAYNRLMISPVLFHALKGYSHVLIHEPDALVLDDQLDHWCARPYDYIGAPWFTLYRDAFVGSHPIGVGNFGLSLLRLSSVMRVLEMDLRWLSRRETFTRIARALTLLGTGRPEESVSVLRRVALGLGKHGTLSRAYLSYRDNCDRFWGVTVPALDRKFRVAPIAEALRFSWEVCPRSCSELADVEQPFGFHAWTVYDFHFLQKFLIGAGVDDLNTVPSPERHSSG